MRKIIIMLLLSVGVSHAQSALSSQSDSIKKLIPTLSPYERGYAAGITIADELLIAKRAKHAMAYDIMPIGEFMTGFRSTKHNLTAQSSDSLIAIVQNPQTKTKVLSHTIGALTRVVTGAESIDSTGVKQGVRDYFDRNLKMNVIYAGKVFYGRDISSDRGLLYPEADLDGKTYAENPIADGSKEKNVTMDGVDINVFIRHAIGTLMQYPIRAANSGIEGKALVTLVVEKDGFISKQYVSTSSGNKLLDAEAMHVVALFPQLAPASRDGKPVRLFFHIPIIFALN